MTSSNNRRRQESIDFNDLRGRITHSHCLTNAAVLQIVGSENTDHQSMQQDRELSNSPSTSKGIFYRLKSSLSSHGNITSSPLSSGISSSLTTDMSSRNHDNLLSSLKRTFRKAPSSWCDESINIDGGSGTNDGHLNFAPCAVGDRSEELLAKRDITVKVVAMNNTNRRRISVANLVVDNEGPPSDDDDDDDDTSIVYDLENDFDDFSDASSHLLDLDNIQHGGGGFRPSY